MKRWKKIRVYDVYDKEGEEISLRYAHEPHFDTLMEAKRYAKKLGGCGFTYQLRDKDGEEVGDIRAVDC